jgi:hypothetical protein
MIPFFRKLRRTLLHNSSPQKYLLYAIGEILLVVLGILIALHLPAREAMAEQAGINKSIEQYKRDQTTVWYMQSLIQEIGNNLDLSNYSLSNVKMDMIKSALALKRGDQNILAQDFRDDILRSPVFHRNLRSILFRTKSLIRTINQFNPVMEKWIQRIESELAS